jgi:hypothetical protein
MFTDADRYQIDQKGISLDTVNQQLQSFESGFPYLKIKKAAVLRDGILAYNTAEIEKLVSYYEHQLSGKKSVKFVPASGAASRMFKSLFEYLEKPDGAPMPKDVEEIVVNLGSMALFNDLSQTVSETGTDISTLIENKSFKEIVKYIIEDKGLNYGNLPKGLLKFHVYDPGNRTAFEEHLVEGALYAQNGDGNVHLHFTVSPEHLDSFKALLDNIKALYEKTYHVKYDVSFSIQKPATDTIAAGADNLPFRNSDGSLLFRPGGHGALLENLNDIDADIVFIKNIDNVVPDGFKHDTILWKKALAGLLLMVQNQVFEYLKKLETIEVDNETLYSEIELFIESKLGYKFSDKVGQLSSEERKLLLYSILNRPLRVCGMVKNTGEPGGGPFWVESESGELSLQILESSQFNLSDEAQKQIFKMATHFNPVDLIAAPKDFKGKHFDLLKFRDDTTGFISIKSKDGKELKALELPGLWNGAMAFWNTLFVEVPIGTFNPVKTINDLLRAEHANAKNI